MKLTTEEKSQLKQLLSSYCRLEIFYSRRRDQDKHTCFWNDETKRPLGSGYYFWFCCPGCLPEGEPIGPFKSKIEAAKEAIDMYGDSYDVDILDSTINAD